MQKQIDKEQEQGLGGPSSNQEQELPVSPDEYPPIDNTIDDTNTESVTPELDAQGNKYASLLNRR